MISEVKNKIESNKLWLVFPLFIVLLAIIILEVNESPGLDGAARSTAIVFWFFPIIVWAGYKSTLELKICDFSNWTQFIFLCLWLIPSIPISLMSLFDLLLISGTGIGIIF